MQNNQAPATASRVLELDANTLSLVLGGLDVTSLGRAEYTWPAQCGASKAQGRREVRTAQDRRAAGDACADTGGLV